MSLILWFSPYSPNLNFKYYFLSIFFVLLVSVLCCLVLGKGTSLSQPITELFSVRSLPLSTYYFCV